MDGGGESIPDLLISHGDRMITFDWVKVLHPTQNKMGYYGDILTIQSPGLVLKILNPKQQKQAMHE